ncbi:aminotransferase class V-fold PLP-dependent enzyme [Pseudogemmobacter sonorensis]|uniref:aminotransferase class V-fold PLP-dependent enzyme n=1 Tax=Pseudogemmobacter sonorensis TaxID=2989681 RepID=UPI0036BDA209
MAAARACADPLAALASGLIGEGVEIPGPFGPCPLVYADYTASGRAMAQVEDFIRDHLLPFYANSHTEASFCGGHVTRMRRAARAAIARLCGADGDHAVIFAGSGATAGVNRLVALLGADGRSGPARVILGPWEHHSNLLPWRESGAEVVELGEDAAGGPDRAELAEALATARPGMRVICAFSAASNVTGEIADVAGLTAQVKAAGARMVWDYAGGGPYLPIRMTQDGGAGAAAIDAVVVSPHKFPGGPAASGVLILRRDAVVIGRPSQPGGGTVRFVSGAGHDYSTSLEAREEAGTPDVIGDIRAALAFIVKDTIGEERMAARNAALFQKAQARWQDLPGLALLGPATRPRLPIFSFRLRDGRGGWVHQQLVTRVLSDLYGIQARGGCACAGPWVHRLLGIGAAESARLRAAILAGDELSKPGFTRLNLSVLMGPDKISHILESVAALSAGAPALAGHYRVDPAQAIFSPRAPDEGAGAEAGAETGKDFPASAFRPA